MWLTHLEGSIHWLYRWHYYYAPVCPLHTKPPKTSLLNHQSCTSTIFIVFQHFLFMFVVLIESAFNTMGCRQYQLLVCTRIFRISPEIVNHPGTLNLNAFKSVTDSSSYTHADDAAWCFDLYKCAYSQFYFQLKITEFKLHTVY